MSDEPPRLAVIDCETTGLDEDLDGHDPEKPIPQLLEVGLVIVDLPTFEIVAETNEVLPCDAPISMWHPKVQAMHRANGLWEECKNQAAAQKKAGPQASFRYDAEQRLRQFVIDAGADGMPMMGAKPGFDRAFLRRYMPKLAREFHYRDFDTNTFWLFMSFISGTDPKREKPATHRALDDCRDAVAVIETFWNFMVEAVNATRTE